jgi:hypothetical protein
VIPIPTASDVEEADPWDTGDMDEMAPREAPRQRKKVTAKPERARRSSSDGMPVTIIVPLVINGLLIAINLFSIVAVLVAGDGGRGTVRGIIPIIVEITIIKGLLERRNRIRWNSIMLDCLGLAMVFLCLGPVFIFFREEMQKQVAAGELTILMVGVCVQTVLWIADIVLLMTPSARDYCNE